MNTVLDELPVDFGGIYCKAEASESVSAVYLHNHIHKSIPACLRINDLKPGVIDFLLGRFSRPPMGTFSNLSRFFGQPVDFALPAGGNGNHRSNRSNPDLCYKYEKRFFQVESYDNCLYFVDEFTTIVAIERKFDTEVHIAVEPAHKEKSRELIREILKFRKKRKSNCKISILYASNGGFSLENVEIKKPLIDLECYYGSDFLQSHDAIVSKLKANSGGLFIFNGAPGTGKTNYIKLLTDFIPDRTFVFIPNNLVSQLNCPDFVKILLKHKDSVLVLEDAEGAIIDRLDNDRPNVVSTILNLSDGILGAVLNTSVIVTFNASRQQIDPALLRKGRLRFRHEFRVLSMDEAKAVARKLNRDESLITSVMSLGDIFNLDEVQSFQEQEPLAKSIGFGR